LYHYQSTLRPDIKNNYLTIQNIKNKVTCGPHPVNNLNTSPVNTPAISELVLAIAGIIFLATPNVNISVTPSILKYFALYNDF
jgi:hypothetical protein